MSIDESADKYEEDLNKMNELYKDIQKVIGKHYDKEDVCIHMILEILENLFFEHIEMAIEEGIEDCNGEDEEGNESYYPLVDANTIERIVTRLCSYSGLQVHEVVGILDMIKIDLYTQWKIGSSIQKIASLKTNKPTKPIEKPTLGALPELKRSERDYSLSEFEDMIKRLGGKPGLNFGNDINNN